MKIIIFFSLILCSTIFSYAQDIIIKNNGERIECRITKIDSTNIYFNTNQHNITLSLDKIQDYQYGSLVLKTFNNSNNLSVAGEELKIYTRHYYSGLTIMCGGYLLTMSALMTEDYGIASAGGILALVGFILQLESHSHIGKAGDILKNTSSNNNNSRFKLKSNNTGIGLAFNIK